MIADAISKTLSERNIIVETVFITDFKFSEAFATQIEAKVVAYQKFLTEQPKSNRSSSKPDGCSS